MDRPRATRSTLDHVAGGPPPVTAEAVAAARARIEPLFATRNPFPDRVAVLFDDVHGFVVDGQRLRIDELGGEADSRILVEQDALGLMIKGELDPRQALVFGGIRMRDGSVPAAMRFGDFLTGRAFDKPQSDMSRLPAPTRDWDRARKDLEEYGYALVEDALAPDELARLRERVLEQAAGERAAGKASIGESAQRLWNLINKGRPFHDLLLNPLIEAFVPGAIGRHAILHGFVAQIALPGNASSIMHYDQISVQPAVDFPIGLNILWFLDDVSEANGGTRIVPGSHRSNVAPDDPFGVEGTVAAEGRAGTALLLDSRVWHSVGCNSTDKPRHVLASYFVRYYMRTQENYALSLLPELFATLDDKVKVMLGFRCTGSLGGVEGPVEGKMVSQPASPVGELDASGAAR